MGMPDDAEMSTDDDEHQQAMLPPDSERTECDMTSEEENCRQTMLPDTGQTDPHDPGGTLRMANGHSVQLAVKKHRSLDDPDVWRWFVVAGVFVTSFIFGIIRTKSTYYVEMMDYFDADSSVASLMASIFYIIYCSASVFVSPISDKYGPRIVIIIGGILVATGLMTSAFAPNIYVCIIAFGVLCGFGFAMSFLTMNTVLLYHFTGKSAALAQLIGISGAGVGGVAMPILVEYFNKNYSWQGGLIILAGMSLNICVGGALVRPTNQARRIQKALSQDSLKKPHILKDLYSLMFIRPFVLVCVQHIFVQASVSILMVHMKATIESISGVKGESGSYVMSYYCATFLLGIILSGTFIHFTGLPPLLIQEILYFIGGVSMALVPVFPTYSTMAILTCFHGFGLSANLNLLPLVVLQFVGESKLRLGYAVIYVFRGVGGLLGPLGAGLLVDYTGYYGYSMYSGGAGFALSTFLLLKDCIHAVRYFRREGQKEMPVGSLLMIEGEETGIALSINGIDKYVENYEREKKASETV